MSANPDARPSSRRSFLAAAAAGTLAGGASFAVQAGARSAAEPDPVLALLEAERGATARFEAALDAVEAAETAFRASGFDRHPRVRLGTFTRIVDDTFNPLPQEEWCPEPVFAHSREEIARGAPPETRAYALARFEADEAEIAAARDHSGLDQAKRREDATSDAQMAAELAVYTATPTTTAGLLAMIDLFAERQMQNVPDPVDELLTGIFAAVRSILSQGG